MEKRINILHVLFASNNKASGVRNVVPKHIEYQSKYANVALLNCNNSNVDEAENKYTVFKLNDLTNGSISQLPVPFNNPNLVVFHAVYYPQYIDLYKQCKKNNIPYIIVPHGSLTREAQKQKWFKKIPANFLLFNGFIKNAVTIQFLTEGEMEKSVKYKSYIIDGNGIELSSIKKQYKFKENQTFKIIYIGRYDTYTKGLDLIVNAVITINDFCRKNKIKVVMYGNDYRGRLKQIKGLIKKGNVEDIIEVNGPVWNEEKINKLCEADIFIHPSRTEGQPLGLMEAIDVGIPCIATKETNYGEVILNEKLGWIAKTTTEDVAKSIMEAFNSRNRLSDISSREIIYAKENFNWDNIAKKTIMDYKEFIDK